MILLRKEKIIPEFDELWFWSRTVVVVLQPDVDLISLRLVLFQGQKGGSVGDSSSNWLKFNSLVKLKPFKYYRFARIVRKTFEIFTSLISNLLKKIVVISEITKLCGTKMFHHPLRFALFFIFINCLLIFWQLKRNWKIHYNICEKLREWYHRNIMAVKTCFLNSLALY